MLITLGMVIGFSLLGLSPLMLCGSSSEFLLAPTFGLATSVFIGHVISANFGLSGADGMAVAFGLLAVASTLIVIRRRLQMRALLPQAYVSLKMALLCSLPAFLILIPAINFGIENFFGAVNYDFFYNSQDSVYLSTHSVLEFDTGVDSSILPLTGSAGPQGRFAISLIGAFAQKFFGLNPLHFNSALLSSLVVINALAFAAVVRSIYCFGILLSSVAVALFIFSGGFAQEYSYYLLGQISALPLFMAVCIYASRLLATANKDASVHHFAINDVIAIVLLLNALYIFYVILCFFALAVIAGAFLLSSLAHKKNALNNFRGWTMIVAGSLAVFLLVRILSLGETKRAIINWIALSLKTAAPGSASPAVFTEYVTEGFLPLLFGFFTYPTNASVFDGLLGTGEIRNWKLLAIGALILLTFFWALTKVFRSDLMPAGAKAIIGSISAIALMCSFAFFVTRSGYAIFKIGDWLIPLLGPILLGAIYLSTQKPRLYDIPFIGVSLLFLPANIITAANYELSFLPAFHMAKFENARDINGMIGVVQLKSQLMSVADRPLIFHLNNGIKNAWLANEFRERTVTALTHNFQPLQDRLLPTMPCSSAPKMPQDAILISDYGKKSEPDIFFSTNQIAQPFFQNEYYSAYFVSKVDRYAFVGRGAYPVETLTTAQAKASGFPTKFRWIEHGVEIYVFTVRSERVDVEFDAIPGFVNGPARRNLRFRTPTGQHEASFDRGNTRVRFQAVDLKPGMNCFYVESQDDVKPVARYGALIRPEVLIDFRFLNFALSSIKINRGA
ncbi:MAG TPA: hypothetical protein VMH34_05475 [Gammaproteobacteria bacterium]|nr:hypothetical protein [Gammaproteobacteria bacterium]